MIHRIDHVAVAVKDHERALRFFCDVLDAVPGEIVEVAETKYRWQTLALGDLSRLELLSPTGPGSFLDGFLRKRDGGFHHITLHTSDLDAMIARLEEKGVPYFGKNEYPGGVWKEVFIHPRDAFGTLVQIAEFEPDAWVVPETKMPAGKRWDITHHNGEYTLAVAHPGGGSAKVTFTKEELQRLGHQIAEALASPR